jgi:hypothetical protein
MTACLSGFALLLYARRAPYRARSWWKYADAFQTGPFRTTRAGTNG